MRSFRFCKLVYCDVTEIGERIPLDVNLKIGLLSCVKRLRSTRLRKHTHFSVIFEESTVKGVNLV